jgi:hypothetical protein
LSPCREYRRFDLLDRDGDNITDVEAFEFDSVFGTYWVMVIEPHSKAAVSRTEKGI